jgi:hypothetical protein
MRHKTALFQRFGIDLHPPLSARSSTRRLSLQIAGSVVCPPARPRQGSRFRLCLAWAWAWRGSLAYGQLAHLAWWPAISLFGMRDCQQARREAHNGAAMLSLTRPYLGALCGSARSRGKNNGSPPQSREKTLPSIVKMGGPRPAYLRQIKYNKDVRRNIPHAHWLSILAVCVVGSTSGCLLARLAASQTLTLEACRRTWLTCLDLI